MKKQKFLRKELICYLGLITMLSSPVCVKASDANTEEAKWFPILVASIENENNILVSHNYKYDKKGNMIQSPVSLKNKVRIMVDDEEYLEKLEDLKELVSEIESGVIEDIEGGSYDSCFSNLFLCDLYGSNLSCFCYTYDSNDKVYEYRFPLKAEDLPKYFDYFVDDRTKEEILCTKKIFFKKYLLENYDVLSYSDGYLVSSLEYKYFNELLAEKYMQLNFLNEDDIKIFRQDYYENRGLKESDSLADDVLTSCDYYYNLNNTYDVTVEDKDLKNEEGYSNREEIRVSVDQYNNPISYTGSYGKNFYNGYDAYGNLIYKVEYSDESETAKRRIEQIDMYTYAYGNPAEYDSNPEQFQTSACGMSINDIVDIVGDDFGFSDNYVRDTYIIEKTKHLIETTFQNQR